MFKHLLRRPLWFLIPGIVLLALISSLLLVHPGIGVHASGGGPGGGSPTLSIQPNPASPGATINVTGFNYPVNAVVKVYFQTKANGIVSAVTDYGGFFNVNLTLPKTYVKGARYYVHADSTAYSAAVLFTFIKPSISVNGNYYYGSVTYGALANLNGSGFAANEAVKLVLDHGTAGQTKLTTLATDNFGYLNASLLLPSIPAGEKVSLIATGAISDLVVSVPLNESPGIYDSPTYGPIGTTVQMTGGAFGSFENVKISFQGAVVGVTKTDGKGAFTFQFQVPTTANLTNYYNNLQAVGTKSGVAVTTSFQVTPSVSITPDRGVAGTLIIVNGAHFSPNGYIYISIYSTISGGSGGSNGGGYSLGYTTGNAKGAIHTSFSVPAGLTPGTSYFISFIDEGSGANVQVKFHAE